MNSVKNHRWVKRIQKSPGLPQFLVLVSFLITFGIVRAITHLQRAGLLPNQHGALHIHHLVPGIFLLLISGYIGISFWTNARLRSLTAILFGVGAALTIDEFALWLYLQDVYWEKQGRDSVDAFIIIAVLLGIGYLISEMQDHFLSRWLHKLLKKQKKETS